MQSTSMQPKPAPPADLSHHLSRPTRARQASSIKDFYKYFRIPGIGQLAGGLPNAGFFPFDTLEASVANINRFKPTPNTPPDFASPSLAGGDKVDDSSSRVVVPRLALTTDPTLQIDLTSALQYGQAQGYPPLHAFLRQFTRENLHPNIPYADGPEIILTIGNTDGWAKCLSAFVNDWSADHDPVEEKEGLVCEEFAFGAATGRARPIMNIVPITVDNHGMLAEGKGGLRDVLENWDATKGKRPHIMYTVTMGQNPTGSVMPVARRKEIYALCHKYDVLIIEDEPYWYLQYPSADVANLASGKTVAAETNDLEAQSETAKSTGYAYLDSLVPSYLSLDTDGRVIRLDTFSKTIAPGCRLGWITAQPAFIERFLRITEGSTQQPSGFVQSLVAQLLVGQPPKSAQPVSKHSGDKLATAWDVSGWIRWLEGLRGSYERRMQTLSRILDEGKDQVKSGSIPALNKIHQLETRDTQDDHETTEDEWAVVQKTRMYDFAWPAGGMFLWLEVLFDNHPLAMAHKVAGPRLAQALWKFFTTTPFKILLSPGSIFGPTDQVREDRAWRFYRICFAAVDDGMIAPLARRIVRAVQAFWRIKDVQAIDKLLEDEQPTAGQEEMDGFVNLAGFC